MKFRFLIFISYNYISIFETLILSKDKNKLIKFHVHLPEKLQAGIDG